MGWDGGGLEDEEGVGACADLVGRFQAGCVVSGLRLRGRVRSVGRRLFLMVMARRILRAGGRDGGVTGDGCGEQGRWVVLFTTLACIMTWQGSFISGIAIGRMKDILVVEAAICSGEITVAWITDFRSGWRGRAGCGRSGQTKRVRGPEVRLNGRAGEFGAASGFEKGRDGTEEVVVLLASRGSVVRLCAGTWVWSRGKGNYSNGRRMRGRRRARLAGNETGICAFSD